MNESRNNEEKGQSQEGEMGMSRGAYFYEVDRRQYLRGAGVSQVLHRGGHHFVLVNRLLYLKGLNLGPGETGGPADDFKGNALP